MSTVLDFAVSITTPSGVLALENPVGGYSVHRESLGTRSITLRKKEITSPYVEGSFVPQAVRENVTEVLSVWVEGPNFATVDARIDALLAGYSQMQYIVTMRMGTLTETWRCSPADYTIEFSGEQRFSLLALVKAQIPRLPTLTKVVAP